MRSQSLQTMRASCFLDGTVVAFHQLSLAVRNQEILCIVGPSGCGKTTLLRCIAGLTDISGGKLLVGGQSGRRCAGRRGDGVPAFRPAAVENRLRQRRLWPGDGRRARPRASRSASRIISILSGLTGFEQHYPYQLSGGMQQRVGLVRALAINPSILLMDEPFAALDAQTREILQEELLHLMERPEERKTMVFITHSIDEAILLGDRVAVMTARPGRIKEMIDMPFPRPRDVEAVRADPRFAELRVAYLASASYRPPQTADRGGGSPRMSVQVDNRNVTALATGRRPVRIRQTATDATASTAPVEYRDPLRVARRRARAVGDTRRTYRSRAVHHAERDRQGGRPNDRQRRIVELPGAKPGGAGDRPFACGRCRRRRRHAAGAVLDARRRVRRLHHVSLLDPERRVGSRYRAVGRLRDQRESHHSVPVRLLPDGDQHLSGRQECRSQAA